MRIKITLLSLAFILSSCQKSNKAEKYLGCYALKPLVKQQCVKKLAKKYIPKYQRNDEKYAKSFQYEHEKLGFKEFLNNKIYLVKT